MATLNRLKHNGIVERSFETDLNCIRSMLYQANFTEEKVTKLWKTTKLYLQNTRNMVSILANNNKLSPNTKFDTEDNIKIERMQPFGRIGLMTIREKMKRKLAKRNYKAIMIGIPKHHFRDRY